MAVDTLERFGAQKDEASPIQRIAVKLTPLAIAALVQNLVDPRISPSEKRKSAELVLAYGWGRPVPATSIDDKVMTRIVIDVEVQEKISKTFDRINNALATAKISPETASVLQPLLELEHLTTDP